MQEILPGVYHWSDFHEGIGARVHSYFVAAANPPFLVDPRMPSQGVKWFARNGRKPHNIYLTNRHHYRHSGRFAKAFGSTVWCHRAGLHEFSHGEPVTAFEHGDRLPGGVLALRLGVLCPEETALSFHRSGRVLAIGDALVREGDRLAFVPDELMGDDPEGVKRGLRRRLRQLARRGYRHLLLAHGRPFIASARAALRSFLEVRP